MTAALASFRALSSLAFGSISGTYANLGTALTRPARAFKITNNTEGDIIYSTNGGTTDHDFLPAGSFVLWDVQSNINPQFDDKFVFPIGAQFAVKQVTAPVSGAVYLTVLQ